MFQPVFFDGEKEKIEQVIDSLVNLGITKAKNTQTFFIDRDFSLSELGMSYRFGATKTVVFSDNVANWVIKVARVAAEDHYCKTETEVFQYAHDKGLQDFFAPSYFFKNVDNMNFYIQAKAECWEDCFSDMFFDSAARMYDKMDFEDEEDYYDAVNDAANDMSDEDRLMVVFCNPALVKFLLEEMDTNDYHEGNFGSIGGNMVLVDYSGF